MIGDFRILTIAKAPQILMTSALLCVFCSGCNASRTAHDDGAAVSFPPVYHRVIEAIVFLDSDGNPFEHPLLGGLDTPRPQFADIDADGDMDLFVQEVPGQIIFFENVGVRDKPRYKWITDRFHDLDVGEWYRMFDFDEDGDFDLLSEERFSQIRYYRNEGTPEGARFVMVVDTLRDVDNEPIFADRQNIPNLTDIDCDGYLDLFLGNITGEIIRYESTGLDSDRVPIFRLVTERFEDIQIIGQIQPSARHGANTLFFEDIDGDGDQDLFWGDYFEPGLLLIENEGTCSQPFFRGDPKPFPANAPVATSGYNAPTVFDFEGDGDLDVFFGVLGGAFNANHTTADNFYFLEQISPGHFIERSRRFIYTVDVGSESIARLADLDGDGDFDLLLANKIEPADEEVSSVYYFENEGTSQAPAFRLLGPMELLRTYHQSPAIADLDADGDLDMLVGKWNREVAYFRNDGSLQEADFVLVDSAFVKLTRGSNSTPALADIDADGDLDLFIGEASGTLNFYRNEGSPQMPRFELVSDEYEDIDVGRRSAPTLVDIDEDGDYDLIVGSEVDGLQLYINTGTQTEPKFDAREALDVPVPAFSVPEFVDIDGDGDLDLFSGGSAGGIVFFENTGRVQ